MSPPSIMKINSKNVSRYEDAWKRPDTPDYLDTEGYESGIEEKKRR